ncbi:hypothetical protein AURDEDRAFT_171385 [Auricularia subglabra TFB-10046 SS5]|uniref:Uncharacterized protein n=1 Tax=Auricularia subglabra (strain TFB-10046 / SS5) TaxID=717982 RepID=J0DC40_AURST|nr:hypothetical protein AURDEDRAFT_171385 [Auricularia subglabra TFB-10046 SS5]
MSLFEETQPSSPSASPVKSHLSSEKAALKRHRALIRAIGTHIDGALEDIVPLLRAALRHLVGMHALNYIDVNGYGHRIKGLASVCKLVLDNHKGQPNANLSVIATLRDEATRRYLLVEDDMTSDEADVRAMDVDENEA